MSTEKKSEAPKATRKPLHQDLQASARIDRIMSDLSEADRKIVYDRFVRIYAAEEMVSAVFIPKEPK